VQAIINFVIIAFLFLWCYELLKSKKKEVVVVVLQADHAEELLTQIRDLLKKVIPLHYIFN
jgi:large-conductance mechanosensitive channel